MIVYTSVEYSNPYQSLLYSQLGSQYTLKSGSIDKAIRQLKKRGKSIYHIQWEEAILSKATHPSIAGAKLREWLCKVHEYHKTGGKIVWTIHNYMPHDMAYKKTLINLRKELSQVADIILVHSYHGQELIKTQLDLTSTKKFKILPHPAYLGVYETEQKSINEAGSSPFFDRSFISFGMIRPYKRHDYLLRNLPTQFIQNNNLHLNIVGKPLRNSEYCSTLFTECNSRPNIGCQFRKVANPLLPDLLRSHAGIIMPYNIMTSGVSILALTLGIPIIAPDSPGMRELLPKEAHFLLYPARSVKAMRQSLVDLCGITIEERQHLATIMQQRALNDYHPQKISLSLGKMFDSLTS